MLEDILKNKIDLKEGSESFSQAEPFSYIILDDFLDVDFASRLSRNFPRLNEMDKQYNGINERKGEHSNFRILSEDFTILKDKVFDIKFVKSVERLTVIDDLFVIDDKFGFGLHQGGNGSYLDIHIDYNLHPIEKKHRRLNMILFLNEEWRKEWGGYLEFWNDKRSKCLKSIEPKFNRCVIFICNETSYHGYSRVTCPTELTRKSFYLYFFTHTQKKFLYHDTIFKPLPSDDISKKIKVIFKENVKNFVKRILYYTGVTKFLK